MTTEQLLPMTPSDLLTAMKSNVSQFDDQLLKANRSYDYRNLALKIKAITSVYNAVVRLFVCEYLCFLLFSFLMVQSAHDISKMKFISNDIL